MEVATHNACSILPLEVTGDVTSCLDECLQAVHERQADLRSQLAAALTGALAAGTIRL